MFEKVFTITRHVVIFILGVMIIIDHLFGQETTVGELIIGVIMVGVLPLDIVISWIRRDGYNNRRYDAEL